MKIMKIAIVGYGNIGKSLVKLLNLKKMDLIEEGLNIQIVYVINSQGGIF